MWYARTPSQRMFEGTRDSNDTRACFLCSPGTRTRRRTPSDRAGRLRTRRGHRIAPSAAVFEESLNGPLTKKNLTPPKTSSTFFLIKKTTKKKLPSSFCKKEFKMLALISQLSAALPSNQMRSPTYEQCIQCITDGRVDDLRSLRKNIMGGKSPKTEWCAEAFMCHACVFANTEAIRFLVTETTVRNSENYLICAAIAGSVETINLLMSFGATSGPCAIRNAAYYGHSHVVEHLEKLTCKGGKCYCCRARCTNLSARTYQPVSDRSAAEIERPLCW